MQRITAILGFLTISFLAFSQPKTTTYLFDENAEPRERFVDFIHLKAELWFEPKAGKVWGTVNHLFKPLRPNIDSLFFDGPNISIKKVTLAKNELKFKTNSQGVFIFFPETLQNASYQIEITYEAFPKKGLYFIGWNDPLNLMQKQIWTQGQGIDNRHWLPCFDNLAEKMTTEMIIHFDKEYQVISNGKLEKQKDEANNQKVWHYQLDKPHPAYLMMLAIGKYEVDERKSKSGVPLYLYYYPEHQNRVAQTYRYSAEMVDFMEDFTGYQYPWVNYKQIPVADYLYGAMENTTATIFGDFFMVDERGALDREYLEIGRAHV